MPKIVDHDERRRSIIEATWRVIAREGIASATTRGIAVPTTVWSRDTRNNTRIKPAAANAVLLPPSPPDTAKTHPP